MSEESLTAAADPSLRWEAILAVEEEATGDGRVLAADSLGWREVPLTLMGMTETSEGGHTGARVVGRIDEVWRDGTFIRARGLFDADEAEFAALVADGTVNGVSVDLTALEMELDLNQEGIPSDDGEKIRVSTADESVRILDATIMGATVAPFQAIEGATIWIVDAESSDDSEAQESLNVEPEEAPEEVSEATHHDDDEDYAEENGFTCDCAQIEAEYEVLETEEFSVSFEAPKPVLVASAAPVYPPADWFAKPDMGPDVSLTVDDDGRVFGRIANFGQCHAGSKDSCVVAPKSRVDYSFFHLGEIKTDEGERVSVGTISMGTGHASLRDTRVKAVEHYDDTGTAVAFVRAYDDEYGIVVAGTIRSDLDPAVVQNFMASKPSGDWRDADGNLELIHVLAVNVPGFPVVTPKALAASAADESMQTVALVAAGTQRSVVPPNFDELAERARRSLFISIANRAA